MRIGRLEFGLAVSNGKLDCTLGYQEGSCFCKLLDVGPLYITWLSHECLSGIYKDKARLYRIKRYLKKRKERV